VTCVALALVVADNVKSWCDAEFVVFWRIIAAAVIGDVLVIQPLYVALTFAWRWLVNDSSEDDGDSDDTDDAKSCGHIVHELHPIHGQWRYEGLLPLPADFDLCRLPRAQSTL
jgi:hypothetical protein